MVCFLYGHSRFLTLYWIRTEKLPTRKERESQWILLWYGRLSSALHCLSWALWPYGWRRAAGCDRGCGAQSVKRVFHGVLGAACLLTMIACIVLFLYPYDLNFTYYYKIDLFGSLWEWLERKEFVLICMSAIGRFICVQSSGTSSIFSELNIMLNTDYKARGFLK